MISEEESRAWRPDLPGWSTDILPFFSSIHAEIPRGGVYVEVGVFLGRSLAYMGELRPDLALCAIDPWSSEPSRGFDGLADRAESVLAFGGLYEAFLHHMGVHAPAVLARTRLIRDLSVPGMASLSDRSADMVFLDGAHDSQSVEEDIVAAKRILKPGGILSGHDYCGDNGIMEAVQKVVGYPQLMPWYGIAYPGWLPGHGTCWHVRVD
jgi:Methyltransferase domain